MNPSHHLWFTEDFTRFFLIPERTILVPGLEAICDLRENRRLVSIAALSIYACSQEEGRQHLYTAWQEGLETAKQAWLDLSAFAGRSGQGIDVAEMSRQFQEGFKATGPEAGDIFDMTRDLVESIFRAANEESQISEAEGRAVFKRVFSQLPQLMDQFSRENLEAAAADPEAWAESLYTRVFGEQEQKRLEQRKNELAEEIRASIEARLVAAGMKPLANLERKTEK